MEKAVAYLYSSMYQRNEGITFLQQLLISAITICVLLIGVTFCVFTAV